jgi:hypothetical protein
VEIAHYYGDDWPSTIAEQSDHDVDVHLQ